MRQYTWHCLLVLHPEILLTKRLVNPEILLTKGLVNPEILLTKCLVNPEILLSKCLVNPEILLTKCLVNPEKQAQKQGREGVSPLCGDSSWSPKRGLKKRQKQERSSGTLGGCYPAFIHVLGFLPFLVTNDDLDDWRTPFPGQEDLPLG